MIMNPKKYLAYDVYGCTYMSYNPVPACCKRHKRHFCGSSVFLRQHLYSIEYRRAGDHTLASSGTSGAATTP
jgi:hypothetical protein